MSTEIVKLQTNDKKKLYQYVNLKLTGLICEEQDALANLCNASALLWLLMEDINWVGFYLMKQGELVLGPFQGKPACTHLSLGRGVCGTAAATREVQLVPDVHLFPGHVACDGASASEIVIPIIVDNAVVAVLDVDSPLKNRFDDLDAEGLGRCVELLVKYVDWTALAAGWKA